MGVEVGEIKIGDKCRILDRWLTVVHVKVNDCYVALRFKEYPGSPQTYGLHSSGHAYHVRHPLDIEEVKPVKITALDLQQRGELKLGMGFKDECNNTRYFICVDPSDSQIGIFTRFKSDINDVYMSRLSRFTLLEGEKAEWSI